MNEIVPRIQLDEEKKAGEVVCSIRITRNLNVKVEEEREQALDKGDRVDPRIKHYPYV